MADQFVVVKTKLVELKGRKCTAEARMETLNGEVVADAKWVKRVMNRNCIQS